MQNIHIYVVYVPPTQTTRPLALFWGVDGQKKEIIGALGICIYLYIYIIIYINYINIHTYINLLNTYKSTGVLITAHMPLALNHFVRNRKFLFLKETSLLVWFSEKQSDDQ